MKGVTKRQYWGKYDMKELDLIGTFAKMIREGQYDESSVAFLVLLLRRWVADRGALWEFSGFVAHRARDRGRFHSELLDRWSRIQDGTGAFEEYDLTETPPQFTAQEIGTELNNTLDKLGFDPIPESEFEDFTLCLMSVLQETAFLDRQKKPFAILRMFHTENTIHLVALFETPTEKALWLLPVFRIDDRSMPWETARHLTADGDTESSISTPHYVVRMIRDGGKLRGMEIPNPPPIPTIEPRP